MAVLKPAALIKAVRDQGGDAALRNLPAIAVTAELLPGFDPEDPQTLMVPSVQVKLRPHPVLDALMQVANATVRGTMSYSTTIRGENAHVAPFAALLDAVVPGTVFVEEQTFTQKGPRDLTEVATWQKANAIRDMLQGTAAAAVIDNRNDRGREREAMLSRAYPYDGPAAHGAVVLNATEHQLYMKIITHQLEIPEDAGVPRIKLNLRPAGKPALEPEVVHPADAVAVVEYLAERGFTFVDPSEDQVFAQLRRKLANSIVAWPALGRPAEAVVTVGRKVEAKAFEALSVAQPGPNRAASRGTATAEGVGEAVKAIEADNIILHPSVLDAAAMAHAGAVEDEKLRDYQREAVGLHAATKVGYLNVCSPGMGKTVMSARGMKLRAEKIADYCALVVVESNVRQQWAGEMAIWFDNAKVVVIEGKNDAAKLVEALNERDGSPLVVITSYAMAGTAKAYLDRQAEIAAAAKQAEADKAEAEQAEQPQLDALDDILGQLAMLADVAEAQAEVEVVEDTDEVDEVDEQNKPLDLGEVLLGVRWNDIIADEAAVLRNTGSKQSAAMWALRERSDVAVALTGTPISRSLDDLGRLVAWVRNDPRMFYGVKLSEQFDMSDAESVKGYQRAIGRLVFRRDKSEISDEIPDIKPIVHRLEGTSAERSLAVAARDGLKKVYEELVACLQTVEQLNPDDESAKEAREALQAARGAYLGGTTLARQASSDPAALLGSESAGAALLAGQGLIEAATRQRGTKRKFIVENVSKRVVENKEKVLIFTEFATVAKGIIADLKEVEGVRVGEVLGGGGKKRDRHIKQFQDGELDVLVCTSSGEKGLNLQVATTLVHYDLPWTPEGVIQRTGRVERIGAEANTIEVVFPIMAGTIEERVAALVVARAVTAMQALDTSRGVNANDTEMGRALGGLVGEVQASELKGRDARMLDITRAVLADDAPAVIDLPEVVEVA